MVLQNTVTAAATRKFWRIFSLLSEIVLQGMAFSLQERQCLGIHGLLPPAFETQERQVYRVMCQLRAQPDDLSRYVILDNLQVF